MKFYVCKTLRSLNYLTKKYDIIKIDKDRNNSKFMIFLFHDTKDFRRYLSNYKR